MPAQSSDYIQTIGRVLLSIVFIVFGYLQATNIGVYIANPTVVKVAGMSGVLTPTIIAWAVAAIDLIGGILILTGFQTRWASIVLIIFCVLTMIFAHNFWTMDGPPRAANMAHFYKNLALIGGLLLLLNSEPGRYSLDARMAKS
jgi:putative oxidoreductase